LSNPLATRGTASQVVPLPFMLRYHHWYPTTTSLSPSPSMSPMAPPCCWRLLVSVVKSTRFQVIVTSAPGLQYCGWMLRQT
jgi:hypothetical protein